MIIVNKNVKLRVGGRKAPAISVDEFVQILVDKLGVNPEVDEVFDIIDNMDDCGKFWKDINKIEVNFENYGPAEEFYGYSDSDFDYRADYLHENLPILMTKSGVPYLCCSGGGDWEVPVVFMIYWDGKCFRGYIPTKGNPWNTKIKAAFNNDTEADNKFIHAQGYPDFDMEEGPEGVVADIDMCIEDFESRIEIC